MIPAPGLAIEEQPEAILRRFLCWGEARNQPPDGRLAVVWACQNRVVRHNTSCRIEALKPLQFSCFNENDPNRGQMLDAFHRDVIGWVGCDAVCALFEAALTTDPTGGATHYINRATLEQMGHVPDWAMPEHGWKMTAKIGAHEFGIPA